VVTEERPQALGALLPSPPAKTTALTFAAARGFHSMIAKSHLEEFCQADIGSA
jgi:hypothetical protein